MKSLSVNQIKKDNRSIKSNPIVILPYRNRNNLKVVSNIKGKIVKFFYRYHKLENVWKKTN